MTFAAAPPFLAAVASFVLAAVVFSRAPDRRMGRVFALMAAALVCWNLNFFALYAGFEYAIASELTWFFRTGAIFVVPTILHLSLVLPGRTLPSGWVVALCASYVCALSLAVLNVFGMLVERLAPFAWGYYSVNTRYYDLFGAYVAITFAVVTAFLAREYVTTTQARMRLQLKLWLAGIAISLPLGLTNLFPSYGIHFYPLGNLGSAIWAAFVGYAIVRHRLMDIEVVVTRGLSYVLVTFLLIVPLSGVGIGLQSIVFADPHHDFSAALVLLLLLAGLLFGPIDRAVSARIEAVLFPGKVESRLRLRALASEVVTILDRDILIELLSSSIQSAFDLEKVALFLNKETSGGFYASRVAAGSCHATEVDQGAALVRVLSKNPEPVLRDELLSLSEDAYATFVREGWEVCVPFWAGGQLLGFIALGRRRGLQAFSAADLQLLGQVAAEASVALQNARLYAELRRSREIITRAGRLSAIGTLAAGIAHEIRNPLVSIQTFFQLAPDRLNDEEFMTSFLKIAEKEVHRISNLVSDLLTFARSPTAEVREVNVNDVVDRTVKLIEPQARADRVPVRALLSREVPLVLADGDQLVQVCINLAINAVQASPPGSEVVLSTRANVQGGEIVCQIEVRDHGVGMSAEVRESIFNPFFTTKDRGSGLGLAICHQLVIEAGGFITVESAEGIGSVFTVNLPAM